MIIKNVGIWILKPDPVKNLDMVVVLAMRIILRQILNVETFAGII
jgi:hypothetical protein